MAENNLIHNPNEVDGFNPQDYLIRMPSKTLDGGMENYLPVKFRVAWFRLKYPDGKIVQNLYQLTDRLAVVEARIYASTAAGSDNCLASAFASRFYSDDSIGANYIQSAGTAAVGKALALAGFGTEFCGGDIGEPEPIDQGVPIESSDSSAKSSEEGTVTADVADGSATKPRGRKKAVAPAKLETGPKIPTTLEEAVEIEISYGAFRGKKMMELRDKPSAKTLLSWFVTSAATGRGEVEKTAAEIILNHDWPKVG